MQNDLMAFFAASVGEREKNVKILTVPLKYEVAMTSSDVASLQQIDKANFTYFGSTSVKYGPLEVP